MLKTILSFSAIVLTIGCAVEAPTMVEGQGLAIDGTSQVANSVPKIGFESQAMLVSTGRRPLVTDQGEVFNSALPTVTPVLRKALLTQRDILLKQNPNRVYTLNGQKVRRKNFLDVIDALLSDRKAPQTLKAISIAKDREVRFTAYYSPEIRVNSTKTKKYKYPLLTYPKDFNGKLPSRKDIERDTLLKKDELAICYAAHVLDVYTMQLQGSGFVRFEDGTRKYLAYGGTNRYPYQSLGLGLSRQDSTVSDISLRGIRAWIDENPSTRDTITSINPNYGFFRVSSGAARGAAGVPLQAMVSVAADPDHYPLGSVLLANVPVANKPGQFETRLLLVQDTGGAINGSRHLDLYTGIGEAALDVAERISSFGEVFLLSTH